MPSISIIYHVINVESEKKIEKKNNVIYKFAVSSCRALIKYRLKIQCRDSIIIKKKKKTIVCCTRNLNKIFLRFLKLLHKLNLHSLNLLKLIDNKIT